MATTGNGVWTPDASSNYNLTTDLAAMAASIDTALVKSANAYKGTAAQREAFTAAPDGTLWSDTNGTRQLWMRQSGAWVVVGDSGMRTMSNTRMAAGRASGAVTTANVSVAVPITFPAGRFTAAPSISFTGVSSAPASFTSITVSGLSATGVTMNVLRNTAGAFNVDWIAVQS